MEDNLQLATAAVPFAGFAGRSSMARSVEKAVYWLISRATLGSQAVVWWAVLGSSMPST
jgi:hypothetical protein